ncbi:DUF4250 domain-containing protein [Clostridium oryzae]|uniref:DUF4250 domain-containing protein n=1 Tax=Clostridium oryzae TaxID=1450648 RepID=A0A1V4IXD3_9CLOT|nr:DUF4250 domain-containing protein [Clostridium oryzae]OPJ64569.1 hypothetical protein CLORY_04350 [Clostridium oryzae]
MDNEQLLQMDAAILLSMVNMKLRDYYSSLDSYCDDANIDIDILINKLDTIGYIYDPELNKFIYK